MALNALLTSENRQVLGKCGHDLVGCIESHISLSDGSGRVQIWGVPEGVLNGVYKNDAVVSMTEYGCAGSILNIILKSTQVGANARFTGLVTEIPCTSEDRTIYNTGYGYAKKIKRMNKLEERQIPHLYCDNMDKFPELFAGSPSDYVAITTWEDWLIHAWNGQYVVSDASGLIIAALKAPKADLQLGDSQTWYLPVGEYMLIINDGDVQSVVILRRNATDLPTPVSYCMRAYASSEDVQDSMIMEYDNVDVSPFNESIVKWGAGARDGTLSADNIREISDAICAGGYKCASLITSVDPRVDSLKDIMWIVPGLYTLELDTHTSLNEIAQNIAGEVHKWGAYWIITVVIVDW